MLAVAALALGTALCAASATKGAGQGAPRARAQRITRDGFSLTLPAGASVVDAANVGGRETYARVADGLVVIRLVRGGAYAAAPSGAQGTHARVCGREATRFEVLIPASEAIGSKLDEEGRVVHLPPVVRLERVDAILRTSPPDGTAVRIEWEIDAAARARWQARERALFASIRCRQPRVGAIVTTRPQEASDLGGLRARE
jgi:hypothetical protein